MTWEKAGSVSLTQGSNIVNGNGTAFGLAVRVGDAFQGPDGGWYEIVNTQSDTQLSIAPPYKGATVANAAYAVAPVQGYNKESADSLRSLTKRFGGTLSVLGSTATQEGIRNALDLTTTDGLPEGANWYYTDARVRHAGLIGLSVSDTSSVVNDDSLLVAVGKLQAQANSASVSISSINTALGTRAAKGPNNDITELSALAKPLTVSQGGTGGATPAAARVGLGLGSAAVAPLMGVVSQSGGLPTGAIVERGANGNGEYVKFADGTMMCSRAIGVTVPIGNPYTIGGSPMYYGAVGWNYPTAFLSGSLPVVCATAQVSGRILLTAGTPNISNISATMYVLGNNETIAFTFIQSAYGRWF